MHSHIACWSTIGLRTLHYRFRVNACFNSPAVSNKLFTALFWQVIKISVSLNKMLYNCLEEMVDYPTSVGDRKWTIRRPVGSSAAWRRSPHQKSAGRESEKRKRGTYKENRNEEKKERQKNERKGQRRATEAKRERCITPMGVKHPLGTVKRS